MDTDFGARASFLVDQIAASYLHYFKVSEVSKNELCRWGKHLNKYFDDHDFKFYVQCSPSDIDNLLRKKRSPFVTDGVNIQLRDDIRNENKEKEIVEHIVANINGSILPELPDAKKSFQPTIELEA